MILVIANAYLQDGTQEKFLEVAQNCISETLKEKGNISYTLTQNAYDKCVFTFIEQWETVEALEAHSQSAHFMSFYGEAQALVTKELEVNVYSAEKIK